jgi:carboxylesterase type B
LFPLLGLFSRGISSSGSALCRWALSDQARDKSVQLAASLGCPTDKGARHIIRCLKQRPAERILEQVEQFQVSTQTHNSNKYGRYILIVLLI